MSVVPSYIARQETVLGGPVALARADAARAARTVRRLAARFGATDAVAEVMAMLGLPDDAPATGRTDGRPQGPA